MSQLIGKEGFEILPEEVPLNIISLAKDCAYRSGSRFRLGAVIYKGREIIGRGWNKADKTHPLASTPYSTIHAEFDAIIKAEPNKVRGADIYIHRILRNGKPALARPCLHCLKMLRTKGIRNIYFSLDIL